MTTEILYLTAQIQRWLNVRVARHLAAQAAKTHPLNRNGLTIRQSRLIVRRCRRKPDGAHMNEVVVLTPERILEVTEDVLRRFGLAKATVVDVARALDVSHGSVYRHFPSKASLRQAVAKRWLDRVSAPLAEDRGRLRARAGAAGTLAARAVLSTKQKKVCEDPEMFATYLTLAREACEVVKAHKEGLVDQIAQHPVRWREAGRLPGRRRQGIGARDFRRHQPLSIIPPMPMNGRIRQLAARIDALLALLLRGLEAPRKR